MLQKARDLRAEDAPEHQHGQAHAVLPQAQAFLQVGDADVERAEALEHSCDLD